MIVMQNLLFAHRQEINNQAKLRTSNFVATRRQAIAMKETLQLNLAMLKRADCKVKRFSDQEMVTSIIDNYCDLMRNTDFPNTTENFFFSEFLITVRRDRDNGLDIDLDCFLGQIVNVLKQDDGPEETLHLWASSHYGRIMGAFMGLVPLPGRRSWQLIFPMTISQRTSGISWVICMVLKALNDMKSDMGTAKKILNISGGTKAADSAWHYISKT
jgi:hypothetical protein